MLSLEKPIADTICPVTEPPSPPPVKNIVEFALLQLVSSTSLKIPFAPIASITSVTVENVAVTYETYGLYDDIIEISTLGNHKDIIVSYTTSGQDDPLLQQAILQFVSTLYDNRADFVVMQGVSFVEIPANVEHILAPLKNAFI